jgi:RNA polymerase sigma factor (TIGR02999 family)
MSDLTQLLKSAAQGEKDAVAQLLPLIYEHLKTLAHRQLVKEKQLTLLTHDLVHEVYFQLFESANLDWQDRGHFFAYAATAMRSIMTDRARQRMTQKKGAGAVHVDIEQIEIGIEDLCADLLALDQCLIKMASKHPRLVKIIELKFFAGLKVEDIAQCLNLNSSTVERDWIKARALIHYYLTA